MTTHTSNGAETAYVVVATSVATHISNCPIAIVTIPCAPKVKKGCGQRKNRRDRDGRARHLAQLPPRIYGGRWQIGSRPSERPTPAERMRPGRYAGKPEVR